MLYELNKYVTTFLHYNQLDIQDSSKVKIVEKLLKTPPLPPLKKKLSKILANTSKISGFSVEKKD